MQKFLSFLRIVFNRRNFMLLLFAVVLVGTLWVAFCLEERWRGRRAWESYRRAAVERGTPVDLEQVVPLDVPDAENFAAIPMVEQLIAAQRDGREVPEWFADLKLGRSKNPKRPVFQGAKSSSLIQWRDYFVEEGVLPSAGADPAADVLAAIDRVEPELAQLREAGKRPQSKFPVDWTLGFGAMIPHLSPLHQAAKVYQLRMAAHLVVSDSAAAYADFSDGLRIYRAIEHEPTIICGLVRISILEGLAVRVRDGMSIGHWLDPELQKMQADFARLDLVNDWRFALNSERALANHALSELTGSSDRTVARFASEVGGVKAGGSQAITTQMVSLYPRGWLWLSQVKANQYFDRSISRVDAIAAGKPLVFPSDASSDVEQIQRAGTLAKLPYLLYVQLTPALNKVEGNYLHCMSTIAQARIACALERHHLKHQAWPEKLDALVPEFLDKVPVDPIAQTAMRYRLTAAGGFDLWSVAPNRIDDSAAEREDKSPMDQPDWVWRR